MSTCVAALYAAAGAPSATTPAQDLVDTWASGGAGSDGFAMVFEDSGGTDAPSIYVKDSGTPANDTDINLTDDFDAFNSFLTYTSPSPKIVRQSDGDLKYCAHNLITYSQQFSSEWQQVGGFTSVTDNAATAPDGTTTAAEIVEDGATNVRYIRDTANFVTGQKYRIFLRAKKGVGTRRLTITCAATPTPNQGATFELSGSGSIASSGGLSADATISLIDEDFYLCAMEFTSSVTGSALMNIGMSEDTYTGFIVDSYAGDGSSSLIIWGAQVTTLPADTTYLPTTSAARYALPIQYDSSNNAEGLLVEPAATNLLTYSSDFSQYTQSAADAFTLTANDTAGPFGTTTMTKVAITDTTNEKHRLFLTYTGSTSAITQSIYIKPGTLQYVALRSYCGNGGANYAWVTSVYDMSGLTVASTQTNSAGSATISHGGSGIEAVGGGFYRIWITTTGNFTTDHSFMFMAVSTGTPTLNAITGDESFAGTTGQYVHIEHAQVEVGSVQTSPIITTGATATRAVDDLNKALTAIEHSATAGTLYAKYVPRGVATSRDIVRLDDGTANEVISIGQTSGAAARLTVTDGGAAQTAPLTSGTVVAAADNKVAASWAANDFAISEGGAAASTDTSGTLPTVTTFDVGAVNGLVKEVLHLPEAMSDGDLASITT